MLPRRAVVVLTLSVICLSGCDRLAKLEAQAEEVVALKRQATQLQMRTEETGKEVSNLRTQVVLATIRINALENLRSREPKAEAQGLSRNQTQALEAAIASCVKVVRESSPADSYGKNFWTEFDAFYNSGSGKVQDNGGNLNGHRPPKFAFNKCMVSKGIPLN